MSEAIWRRTDSQAAGDSPDTSGERLEAVRRTVMDLVETVPAPRRLVVRAGDVEVDIDWRAADGQPAMMTMAAPMAPAGPATAGTASAGIAPADPGATAVPVAAGTPAAAIGVEYVCSPSVGTFYVSPEPGADPFVAEGSTIRRGQKVAIVEAMKLMLPVESDQSGQIVEILVADGQDVEYGERLFAVRTEG